jgi:hypothetical protein
MVGDLLQISEDRKKHRHSENTAALTRSFLTVFSKLTAIPPKITTQNATQTAISRVYRQKKNFMLIHTVNKVWNLTHNAQCVKQYLCQIICLIFMHLLYLFILLQLVH